MKIVFSTGHCEKDLGTVTKLVASICECLIAKGHECYIIGASYFEGGHDYFDSGLEIIRFVNHAKLTEKIRSAKSAYQDYAAIYQNTLISKIKYAICHPIQSYMLRMGNTTRIGYGKNAYSLIRKINPDVVICVQDPFWETLDLLRYLKKFKGIKAIYQVDPWGLFDQDKVKGDARTIADELRALSQIDYLFTTEELHQQHRSNKEYHKYLDISIPLGFPNMFPKTKICESDIFFDESKTHILYTGSLTPFREPSCFLKLIEKVMEKNNMVCCHFLGEMHEETYEKCFKQLLKKYPDNIFVYDSIAPEKVYSVMEKADFLLNIGNLYTNMVPSKIFDYFSTGKQIINMQKIEQCPSRKYFEKYPHCLTVEEWHSEDYLVSLQQYLQNSVPDLEYCEIEKIYIEHTPEYVANSIISKIEMALKN